MAKRLIWSLRAQVELISILSFWVEHNQSDDYSRKLRERINAVLTLLCENNFLGKPTNNQNVRSTVCDKYLIIYEILENDILVLTIFDGRRNPGKLIYK